MTDDKRPREFCIDLKDMFSVEASGVPVGVNGIHVIEYSAYAALKKENDELRLSMTTGDRTWNGMNREIASLRESLKLAEAKIKFAEKLVLRVSGASLDEWAVRAGEL